MKRFLGHTGLAVHPIGLGGMPLSIQGKPDEHRALAVIDAFLDGGGDFIDTAISYCLDNEDFGANERLIAKALRGRTNVVVATKGGLTRPGGRWDVDASPQWLRRSCEQSARDLGAPIALYYLHAVDSAVPLADSVGELVRLRAEGKIAAIGLSNVDTEELEAALTLTPIAAVQNRCNIFDRRDFTSGLIERCRELGIAYVAYSPVGGHSGHRRLGQEPTLARLAAKHGTTVYAVALAWLLAKAPHIVPIPGASRVASVANSLSATAVLLDSDDIAAIDDLGGWRRTR